MNFNVVKITKAKHNQGMELVRLPSEAEISVAYDQGKEAVIILFHATFRNLVEHMLALEEQLEKNSHKSSKPPSSDWTKKRPTKRGSACRAGRMEAANPDHLDEEMERFITEIQPILQGFTVTKIMRACHCSPTYVSFIKKLEYVRHPVFYKDLEKLINNN